MAFINIKGIDPDDHIVIKKSRLNLKVSIKDEKNISAKYEEQYVVFK